MKHSIIDPLDWLLETDTNNPGVRFFALRDLLHLPLHDPQLSQAQADIMVQGPVPSILDAQHPDGYWARPGGGYTPSYTSTFWQIVFLADLGATNSDARLQRGCEYLMRHHIASNGAFAISRPPVPSSAVHCINGLALYALMKLGYGNDPRVMAALDWLCTTATGQASARYYKSGTSGSGFACAYNLGQPCAWGAVKALKALGSLVPAQRTAQVEQAIERGIAFLLDYDLAAANYPYTERINSSWFIFGFPLSYRSDLLETTGILVNLGCEGAARLEKACQFIASKRDHLGRWKMEKTLNGKMWVDIEQKGKSSKWLTLRAMQILCSIEWN